MPVEEPSAAIQLRSMGRTHELTVAPISLQLAAPHRTACPPPLLAANAKTPPLPGVFLCMFGGVLLFHPCGQYHRR